jgi:hypothetical protein
MDVILAPYRGSQRPKCQAGAAKLDSYDTDEAGRMMISTASEWPSSFKATFGRKGFPRRGAHRRLQPPRSAPVFLVCFSRSKRILTSLTTRLPSCPVDRLEGGPAEVADFPRRDTTPRADGVVSKAPVRIDAKSTVVGCGEALPDLSGGWSTPHPP